MLSCEVCESASGCGTRIVVVTEPCTCGAVRWWNCECIGEIARYVVAVHDTIPDAGQLAWIRLNHPGKTLRY